MEVEEFGCVADTSLAQAQQPRITNKTLIYDQQERAIKIFTSQGRERRDPISLFAVKPSKTTRIGSSFSGFAARNGVSKSVWSCEQPESFKWSGRRAQMASASGAVHHQRQGAAPRTQDLRDIYCI